MWLALLRGWPRRHSARAVLQQAGLNTARGRVRICPKLLVHLHTCPR